MEYEPERVLELYQNGRMLDLEDQLARDLHQADQYIKSLVAQGASRLEAEDRAVELILAPQNPQDPQYPDPEKPPLIPPSLRREISDKLEAVEEGISRAWPAKVSPLRPKS